jgi:hypothetical protein
MLKFKMAAHKIEISEEKKIIQDSFSEKLSNKIIELYPTMSKNIEPKKNLWLTKISDGSKPNENKIFKGGKKIGEIKNFSIDQARSLNAMLITSFENKLKLVLSTGTVISCVHKKATDKTLVDIYIYQKPPQDNDESRPINKFEFVNTGEYCYRYEITEKYQNSKKSEKTEIPISFTSIDNSASNLPILPINAQQIIDNAMKQLESRKNRLEKLYCDRNKIDIEIKEIEEEVKKYAQNYENPKISIISYETIESENIQKIRTSQISTESSDESFRAIPNEKADEKSSFKKRDTTTVGSSYASALKANI